MVNKHTQLVCQMQIRLFQLFIRSIYSAASCHHNEIPAWLELGFVEPVDLPQTAPYLVAHHGVTQLCADGQADAVFTCAVFAAIKHKIAVGTGFALVVKPTENVIQFEGFGKFHKIFPLYFP